MLKYRILKPNKDFCFLQLNGLMKGSRRKRTVLIKTFNGVKFGFFKYESYNCSEACSEKLSHEIAKVLRKKCAKIEFAVDEIGELGIISYFFVDSKSKQTDAKDFFNKSEFDRKSFLTINNIKEFLEKYTQNGFNEFLGMMVFDALVGESDRHEENWGLLKTEGKYRFSPLYDNSCNLLREFKDKELAEKYYSGQKDFDKYILRSKTYIYDEETGKQYRHMDLIVELLRRYPKIMSMELKKIKKLTNKKIEKILSRLPEDIIEIMHKNYIYKYIVTRKKLLLKILKEGDYHEH